MYYLGMFLFFRNGDDGGSFYNRVNYHVNMCSIIMWMIPKKDSKALFHLTIVNRYVKYITKWVKIPKKGQFLAAFKCLVLQLTYAKYSKFESNFEFWI